MNLPHHLIQDIRQGIRQLRLNPGFTAVAALSLALGIGANTAIFELINAVRLRPLPVNRPQELAYVDFEPHSQRSGNYSTRSAIFSSAQWDVLRTRQQAFTEMVAWSASRFNLATGGPARYAEGQFVSDNFFRVLGVNAIAGRVFGPGDDSSGCASPGAVISYAFWQREFAGDPRVVERGVKLNGRSFPVIGVTPTEFFGVEVGHQYDVAIPICADRLFSDDGQGRAANRRAWWLAAMGRLKPGWTLQRAEAHIKAISPVIMAGSVPPSYRADDAKKYLANKLVASWGRTGVSNLREDYNQPLWLLFATTGLVLLIACANLANLLLARASVREREIAVRQAIGASRGRLTAQLLTESLLLAMLGAGLGLLLAKALSQTLAAFLNTTDDPTFLVLNQDLRVFGFIAGIAVLTCILFGLAPALRATRVQPASAMRASGRGLTAGRERFSLRRGLVVAQVALSMVLLVGALLFVRSLQKLMAANIGFRPDGVVTVNFDLARAHFSKERLAQVHLQLLRQVRAYPGVKDAAEVYITPVSGSGWNNRVYADGRSESGNTELDMTSPGYFRTMGTSLLAGRDFNERDTLNAPKIAIVNEAFAKQFFNGANPVGRVFHRVGDANKPDEVFEIVGLVGNTKYYQIREDFRPIAYWPIAQDPDPNLGVLLVLRTSAPEGELLHGVQAVAGAVHPEIGIEIHAMTAQLKDSLLRDRLMAALAGSFGLLAALLAMLGLYGVIAYMVARRRNEIGVRIALGADRARVMTLVLREAVVLLAMGVVIGAGLAVMAARAAETLLFGLKPHDPGTLAAAVVLLAITALAASYGPARRAARVEPVEALRED